MDNEIRKNLEKFKITTVNIIEDLYKEKYENLQILFDARQMLIDEISTKEYDNSEFIEIAEKLQLKEYDKELNRLMHQKRQKLMKHLQELNTRKNVRNNYSRKLNLNPGFFSREI